jgi:general secretion pathway protein J
MKKRVKVLSFNVHSGFTLIEVIISLTVLGFILLIIFGGFRLGLSAWDRGESIKEEHQTSRIISQLVSKQVKSIVPYRVKTKKAEGDYLAFEGKPRSLKFVSSLPIKGNRAEGFVHTVYQFEEDGKEGGRLVLYEQRVLNRDFFEEEPRQENRHILMEGVSKLLFEYYQEENPSKNQSEQWLEEWNAKEMKELPGGVRMTLTFREPEGKESTLALLLPISATKFEEVRTMPAPRRGVPRGGQ